MTKEAPIALVTDALWRKSVCAIRALGKSGYRVSALGESRVSPGFYSRYCQKRFRGPLASEDPDGFGEVLHRAIAAARGEEVVLLPMEDATCEWVLRNGSSLPANVHWLLPEQQSFAIARDKGLTMLKAQELGIPCPKTFFPKSVDELSALVAGHDVEEFVLKPRTGSGSSGLVYGASIRSVSLAAHWNSHGPLLLQERVPAAGEARGVSYLFDAGGQPRAAFAHRRLRQYPVGGGPSTQRESVPLDELHEHSEKLLRALGWRGVAMVEWKLHPNTGRPMLLEINPRFWGSLALAVHAGVDFPTRYVEAALGRPQVNISRPYGIGVTCRWLVPGDLLRYVSEPAAQRESLVSFVRGALRDSEEFDRADLSGSFASTVAPFLLAAQPRYWRYLRRSSTPSS